MRQDPIRFQPQLDLDMRTHAEGRTIKNPLLQVEQDAATPVLENLQAFQV